MQTAEITITSHSSVVSCLSTMPFDLKDKIIFITGGATGIGAQSLKLFLDEGVKHITVTDVNQEEGKKLENELNSKYGGRVKFVKCDVTNDEELFSAYKKVIDEYRFIDVVINNAAIMNDGPSVYKKAIAVNITALVTSTLKARELMRKDRSGRGGIIVNVSSVAALNQGAYIPIYYGMKSAVLQFSNCIGLPENYEQTGIKVITMCYGATNTSLISEQKLCSFDEELNKDLYEYIKKFPLQSAESAAKGLIEACKHGESGSTWLSKNDLPVEDITPVIKKAYSLLTDLVF